jgi:hypothetical protein
MRFWIAICCIALHQSAPAQHLNLTNFQHELRWLDETRFPPVVKDPAVSDSLLEYAAATLSLKFKTEGYSRPEQINYRLIDMFGKPRMQSPAATLKDEDLQASVLSFLTRATTGYDVYWHLKVEVRKRGKTVYHRETSHQLVNYEPGVIWLDETNFLEHFKVLFEELLDMCPALSSKYVIGKGIDYAELLKNDGELWEVDRKSNPAGFGTPSFGPYTTLDAGKFDTAEIRSKTKKRVGETEAGISSEGLIFDQFKTIDFAKTIFCFLWLGSGRDTVKAVFSIDIRKSKTRRTFLSEVLSNDDEYSPSETQYRQRNVSGNIRTDTTAWAFTLQNFQENGSPSGGHLTHGETYYWLKVSVQGTNRRNLIIVSREGEYLASLSYNVSGTQMRMRKNIDPQTANAIATLYAVLMSVKNVQ